MLEFLKAFTSVKGHDAIAAVNKAIAEHDPVGASAADLAVMEQDLDKAGLTITSLRSELATDQAEYDAHSRQHTELIGAAEILQGKIAAATGGQKASLEASLTNLLGKIEPIVAQLDREKKALDDTQALLTEAEEVYQQKAKGLTEAKASLEQARHDLQHAKIEEERSQQRADQAAVVAGLRTSSTTGLNTALTALQESAKEARARADTNNLKANALHGTASEDANIAAALDEARGKGTSDKSLADRLAALKR